MRADDGPADHPGENKEPEQERSAAAFRGHQQQHERGQHQVELLFNRQRPAPGHELPVDGNEAIHIQNVGPDLVGM
jgi:hypothetical protein